MYILAESGLSDSFTFIVSIVARNVTLEKEILISMRLLCGYIKVICYK